MAKNFNVDLKTNRELIQYEEPQFHLAVGEKKTITAEMILDGSAGVPSFKKLVKPRPRPRTPPIEINEPLFDKVPNYLASLSKSAERKFVEKTFQNDDKTCNDLLLINRDPSPEPENLHNKIPAYHSNFTNSTKFDECEDFDEYSEKSLTSNSSSFTSSSTSDSSSEDEKTRELRLRKNVRRHKLNRSSSSSLELRSRSRSRSSQRHRRRSNDSWSQNIREERRRKKIDRIEQRRIIYVGRLPDTFTKLDLRLKFKQFGEIECCNIHMREAGDNYGFVTFSTSDGAFKAIENGNKVKGMEKYDICFGGRRAFCGAKYADLDGKTEEDEEMCNIKLIKRNTLNTESEFDILLQQALIKKNKK